MNIYYTIIRKIRFPKLSRIFQIKTATSKTMHNETKGEKTETFLLDFKVFVSKQKAVFSKKIDASYVFNK